MTIYDPENWFETAVRGIKDYAISGLDPDIYEVVDIFPATDLALRKVPLDKTVIHFNVDDIDESPLGIGDNYISDNYDEINHTVDPQYSSVILMDFDVGVWSSDKSGGTTALMRARQILSQLFGIPWGIEKLRAATQGADGSVELISYSGGRLALDKINDVRTYRIVNGTLGVRVFSRTPLTNSPAPTIETISQSPGLTILG